jgi:hypothetical protein
MRTNAPTDAKSNLRYMSFPLLKIKLAQNTPLLLPRG